MRLSAPLAVAALLVGVAACIGPAPAATPNGLVTGRASAGPVCPVETNPPDPNCAARPVAGALIVALDAAGREVGRAMTAADGTYALTVPHGQLLIAAQPVEGLMSVSEAVAVTIDGRDIAHVADFSYDTGIR